MKTIRVAINGFGRIGRLVYRVLRARPQYEVVAINDLASAETLAHLLKYDSVHGRYPGRVSTHDGSLVVDGQRTTTFAERSPSQLPWAKLGIDVVVEATGIFRKREQCMGHIEAGAKRVVLTVPPADELDAMIVMGVNDDALRAEHQIISNASCTTNCLAPLAKVLNDRFGIASGLMTTVHAYTNDQPSGDQVHKDLRRARAASLNIIPTTTGAARAVGKVIPELDGKLDGCALRVPVPDGSVVDLTAELERPTTREEINAAFAEAARGSLEGILAYTDDPIVSSDIIGDPHSSIIDGGATMVSADGKLVKVISWYDNEWGYSNRVVDLLTLAHRLSLRKAA